MCTLAFALRPVPGVVFAASGNRNEFLARPAVGPRVWAGGVLAPRDEQAGGTWLGLNAHGLFACLTNRRGANPDRSRPSRGLLVDESLHAGSASELRDRIANLPGDRYNGFHLLWSDAREAHVAICDGERLEVRALAPGELQVVTERSYGAGEGVRETEVFRECAPLFAAPNLTAASLRPPMQRHGPAPLESACVHADELRYGTRSSLQLVLRENGVCELLWTDGHPCTEPARDLSRLATDVIRGQYT
jgi:uncharacterized protein with NRDE domain